MKTKYDIGQTVYYESQTGLLSRGVIREVSVHADGERPALHYYIAEHYGASFAEDEISDNLFFMTNRLITKEDDRHHEQRNRIIEKANEFLDDTRDKVFTFDKSEAGCSTSTPEGCDCQDGPCDCELGEPGFVATCPCGEHSVRFY